VRIRLAIPDHLVTPAALEAALEATTLANEQAVRHGEVPQLTDAIRGGVKWKPEPFTDGEHFDLSHQVAARGWGDCDDLAPWLAGELRASGEDPGARPRVYKTGPNRWHVVTETSDGQILDPSKWAGMGRKKSGANVQGVSGSVAAPFAHHGSGALCVVPKNGKWWSRCDIPWADGSGHLASHARARSPEEALHRAVAGAIACGDVLDPETVERAREAGIALLGHPSEVGSLFGSLLKGATSFIPGGGAALEAVKLAKSAAGKLAHGGGAKKPEGSITHPNGAVSAPVATPSGQGDHMTVFYHPAYAPGPVIMRF